MLRTVCLLFVLCLSGVVNAGVWCTMDKIHSVDTTGSNKNCYISGYINNVFKEDINICTSTEESANSRNLSIALTAFMGKKKLVLWFDNHNSCSDIPARWANDVERMSIRH